MGNAPLGVENSWPCCDCCLREGRSVLGGKVDRSIAQIALPVIPERAGSQRERGNQKPRSARRTVFLRSGCPSYRQSL